MPPQNEDQAKKQLDDGLEKVNEAAQFPRDDDWDVRFLLEGSEATGDIEYEPITKTVILE